MAFKLQLGYPDYVGKRFIWSGPYVGPKPYVTGGDPLVLPRFNNYIDSVFPSLSVSGTYEIYPTPSQGSPRMTWKMKWVVFATGAEVANATDLSGETVILSGFGGVY